MKKVIVTILCVLAGLSVSAQKHAGLTVYANGGMGYSTIQGGSGYENHTGTYNIDGGIIWKTSSEFGIMYELGYSKVGADLKGGGKVLYDNILCGTLGFKLYAGRDSRFYFELSPLDITTLSGCKTTVGGVTTKVRPKDDYDAWDAAYKTAIWGVHVGCGYTFQTRSSRDLMSVFIRMHQDITPFNKGTGDKLRFNYSEIGIQLYLFKL
ncbi:MAG: hypothetical protein LKI42_03240 [Bacteroidales bacterium]|jgi:hypothetical protein|nr:hypothetical protein [Bacteroidales bacterium]MCI1785306.1 hypothetical protein [Bacteroidales bacterium]